MINWDEELEEAQINLEIAQEIEAELAKVKCWLCMDTGYRYFTSDYDPESEPTPIKVRCQCQTNGIQYL